MSRYVPFVDLEPRGELLTKLDHAYHRVMNSGTYIGGREVQAFEEEWAEYCEAKHCIALQSGTQGLQLLVGEERYVVPAESLPTIDALRRQHITIATTPLSYDWQNAVIVHLYGIPVRPPLGTKRVIEDCCQAHGARINGGPVGKRGFAAVWSFYPTKNLGAYGDAGAVTTDDDDVIAGLRDIRYARMDPLQAAFLRVKLPYLDGWNERRREIAERYLQKLEGVGLPQVGKDISPNWHLFVIRHPERDRLKEVLHERGIETMIHYPGTKEVLSLPCAPHLSYGQVARVIEAVNQCAS